MSRTVQTASGETQHRFECVDRSCFRRSTQKRGTEDETDLIKHVFLKEREPAHVLSWMVKRRDAETPVFTYSRVKQLQECTSPAP